MKVPLIHAFPQPRGRLRQLFADLATIRGLLALGPSAADKLAQFGDIDSMPHPWEPASLSPALRNLLWAWLDEVATWLNEDYVWDPDVFVPECWPHHPQIVHELAMVASTRQLATQRVEPGPLEEWQRVTLPAFRERFRGQVHCKPGDHGDWPARSRFERFDATPAHSRRMHAFLLDTGFNPEDLPDQDPTLDTLTGDVGAGLAGGLSGAPDAGSDDVDDIDEPDVQDTAFDDGSPFGGRRDDGPDLHLIR